MDNQKFQTKEKRGQQLGFNRQQTILTDKLRKKIDNDCIEVFSGKNTVVDEPESACTCGPKKPKKQG